MENTIDFVLLMLRFCRLMSVYSLMFTAEGCMRLKHRPMGSEKQKSFCIIASTPLEANCEVAEVMGMVAQDNKVARSKVSTGMPTFLYGPLRFMNHCCDPNCAVRSALERLYFHMA
jgi:SET domain-containing protein